ncbi:hypothetical protein NSE01_34100 [Novosphingobium sediminis]|uniref:Uncharacterized protein n=1 Tax=Novosphingobium sediminis TaxID=707214 RepID=A0A512APE4_9SPHN|nr:hypothetical protein [Novosphingobium sediminis]GEO01578.1 hypothetical protein NSE01_34100 [Novosphingobium sediminis]
MTIASTWEDCGRTASLRRPALIEVKVVAVWLYLIRPRFVPGEIRFVLRSPRTFEAGARS